MSIFLWTKNWAEASKKKTWAEPETTSTNEIAKKEHGFDLYLSDQQSSGKGRGENRWLNPPPGSSLISSWTYKLSQPPQHITSPLIGLALYQSAQIWQGLPWSLKAPNDLYLGPQKIAGLLVETVSQGGEHQLTIGLGFNVLAKPDLDIATCLADHIAVSEKAWLKFLSVLDTNFNAAIGHCLKSGLEKDVQNELLRALNENPHLKEKYLGVDQDGNLQLKDSQVSWRDDF